MNWTALYAILKKSINTTKEELEQEIEEKIGLTNQFLDELPETGESGVLYFIPKDDADPSAEDQYFMYVWDPDNTEFVLLDPDVDLSPYAKSADLATVATSGLYSDLSGTPDLTPYITEAEADEKYMSYDILEEETVTGNPITFDSLDGGYAKSCEVTFSPIQDLHGQSAPYPAGGSKNRITPKHSSATDNGVTYTVNDDGTITANGKATATSYFSICQRNDLYDLLSSYQGQSVIGSGCPSGGGQYKIAFTRLDGSSFKDDLGSGTSAVTIGDLSSSSLNAYIRIQIESGYTANNLVFKPMLCLSTEQNPDYAHYAPYSNICPISGRDSLSLARSGKNLFDFSSYKNNITATRCTYTVGDNSVTITATGRDSYIINSVYKIENKGQMTVSWSANNNNDGRVYVFCDGEPFAYANNGETKHLTFTPPVGTEYITIRFGVLDSGNSITYSNIQVELGSTATYYNPYIAPTNHTATFSETVYGGKWLPQEGKAVIDSVMVDISTLSDWRYSNNVGHERFSTTSLSSLAILPPTANDVGDIICSHYKTVSNQDNFSHSSDCTVALGQVGNGNLFVYDSNYTDVASFISAISGVQLVYKLKTPTEITLTAEQIELLKGQNVLFTDGDNITLTAAQLELIKVKANPSGQATDTLSKLQINDDIFGIPAELPVVASTDEGKVLTVNSSGEWEAADIPAQVEANPIDTATTDLTKLGVGGTVYGIPGAPTIVANPSGAATDILDKLQVGSTVYATPKQLDYSTAEQKTGVKWIDGRDIYQRTFVKALASSPDADSSSFLIASGLDTIDVLIDISGTVKANGVHAFCGTTGLINANGWKYSIHLDSDDQLVVWAGSSSDYYNEIAGGKAFITIKYVKNLYPVSDPWPTGTGYGIGNFEWDDQMTADIATDAHSWDSRYFTSDDPWWIKYISTNLDGSINVKAQHAWMDEEPESANHFTFNKYYEPFYITTDTSIAYGCYAWASYTVAQDGTITRTGADYERCDVEPKLYIRSTDSYLTQINDEWFFKMHQEIPGYLIYANWSKLSNWLVESGNYQHIKEPLWKVN